MTDIKKIYAAYEEATTKADQLDEKWEQEPENEKIEKAWDAAYKKQMKKEAELAKAITTISSNMIDEATALLIIRKKPAELKNLVLRLA